MKKQFLIVSGVTFAVFFAEALIHYNYGILESLNLPFKWSNFKMPKGKSLLKLASIVLVASAVSGVLIEKVEKQYN
jgi:hypothetical protein